MVRPALLAALLAAALAAEARAARRGPPTEPLAPVPGELPALPAASPAAGAAQGLALPPAERLESPARALEAPARAAEPAGGSGLLDPWFSLSGPEAARAREERLEAALARGERLAALHDGIERLGPGDAAEVRGLLDAAWEGRAPGVPRQVLFVCTGNQGRSPMAEQLFRDEARRAGEGAVAAVSRGLAALPGLPIDLAALLVLREDGIEASHHRSRQLTEEDVARADLVLAMEDLHALFIERDMPEAARKVFRLKDYAGLAREDVAEPEDSPAAPLDAYRASARELREAARRVLRVERALAALSEWLAGRKD